MLPWCVAPSRALPGGPDSAEGLTLGARIGDDGCRGGLAPGVLGGDCDLVALPWCDPGVAGLGGEMGFSCWVTPLAQGFEGHCVPQDPASRLRCAQSL